ncbi:hypothetical protein EMPG_11945 [Blastomyces silverae]|uniref:PNPLA domain-containing protein n=1 Tax=Blastomyces silverae TaxID=2060906 RepID=A0A0H1BPY4_9EURO|nr:hypothetical protein EMPG_11945 [Blastomyces silverae]
MLTKHGDEPSPLDTTGLCLLSLDGGGVRGFSTLYVLKSIMDRLNNERKKESLDPVKPCEVFDLIGGTSTGGLIALMLGRLEMTVDECIAAYSDLAEAVFSEKRILPFTFKGQVKSRFNSARLESAIKQAVAESGASETDLLNDGTERGCQTFVCSIDRDTKDIVRLRSYSLPDEPTIPATICQAARATSAATTFFDPVSIDDRNFADGGLGANNPVDEMEGEAANIWCPETGDLKPLVKCFISIGTGNPGKEAFEDSIYKFLGKTMVDIATETEATEKKFIARWAKHFDEKRYFRFNVEQGLQNIGLEEYEKKGRIKAVSEQYLIHTAQKFRVRDCIKNLRLKKSKAATNLSNHITEYNAQRMIELRIKSPTKAPSNIPFERNPRFVGRAAEIAQINTMLSSETRCERVAIVGLGGVGKTQIALEFTHQLQERHPDCSVFWIPVTSVESMLEAYLAIGQQLQIPNLEREKADIQRLVKLRLDEESSGRWLLVFDNADDIEMWMEKASGTGNSGNSGRRIDYLPKSKHGSILFTTRNRKAATKLAGTNIVLVGEMDDVMAKDLLKRSLLRPDLLTDDQAATDLLKKLTHLPLAVVQAAFYINVNGITLAEYTALLDDTEEKKIDLLSENFEDLGRYKDAKNPVATTWLLSFEQIQKRDKLAAEYLSFMSCLDAKDIPQSLLPPAQSAKRATDAIGTLSAYSFITRHKTGQLLDLHRLVHLATRNWLRMEGTFEKWATEALKQLEEVFPDDDHTKRSIWRMYLPHARYALELELEGGESRKTNLLWRFGKCALSDGMYRDAEKAYAQLMETHKKKLGADHPYTLASMGNLAEVYRSQGRLNAAEKLNVQVMETHKKKLGADHLDTLTSMSNLTLIYLNQGQLDAAEELGVQVMKTCKKKLGVDHPDTLGSMGNLAEVYRSQGRLNAAEKLNVQVMETRKKKLGVDHPDTLGSMGNLASTYRKQGWLNAAEELGVQVMKTWKKKLGVDHPDTLGSMGNLASTYRKQGWLNAAEELGVQVMKTWKKKLGADHPDTLISMGNLASTYKNQGQLNAAEELEMHVMETSKKKLGVDHPNTLTSMNNLAITRKKKGQYAEAISLMRECVQLRQHVLGLDHPSYKSSLSNLTRWEAEQAEAGVSRKKATTSR